MLKRTSGFFKQIAHFKAISKKGITRKFSVDVYNKIVFLATLIMMRATDENLLMTTLKESI